MMTMIITIMLNRIIAIFIFNGVSIIRFETFKLKIIKRIRLTAITNDPEPEA